MTLRHGMSEPWLKPPTRSLITPPQSAARTKLKINPTNRPKPKGRMYRLFIMFKYFTYNLSLSLLVITLLRNLAYVFFLLHWWVVGAQESGGCGVK